MALVYTVIYVHAGACPGGGPPPLEIEKQKKKKKKKGHQSKY